MKNIKKRIEKLEEEVNPQRFIKLKIVSHIPGLPSQTMLIPAKKKKR
jgi:hypothetical protein